MVGPINKAPVPAVKAPHVAPRIGAENDASPSPETVNNAADNDKENPEQVTSDLPPPSDANYQKTLSTETDESITSEEGIGEKVDDVVSE